MPAPLPHARKHNPAPEYIRGICLATGLSMYKLADRIGVTRSVLYKWMTGASDCPYPAQFTIEALRKKKQDEVAAD